MERPTNRLVHAARDFVWGKFIRLFGHVALKRLFRIKIFTLKKNVAFFSDTCYIKGRRQRELATPSVGTYGNCIGASISSKGAYRNRSLGTQRGLGDHLPCRALPLLPTASVLRPDVARICAGTVGLEPTFLPITNRVLFARGSFQFSYVPKPS